MKENIKIYSIIFLLLVTINSIAQLSDNAITKSGSLIATEKLNVTTTNLQLLTTTQNSTPSTNVSCIYTSTNAYTLRVCTEDAQTFSGEQNSRWWGRYIGQ